VDCIFFERKELGSIGYVYPGLYSGKVKITDGNTTDWATIGWINIIGPNNTDFTLQAGDIIKVTAEEEIECTVTNNTELVSAVTISGGWVNESQDLISGGFYLNKPMGNDASVHPIHYWVLDRASSYKLSGPLAAYGATVQFRVRCRSTDTAAQGQFNNIKGYGHMSVEVWR
jgi:hypothetical protein